MNNVKLMNKVKELEFQTLKSREQSSRVMVQVKIITDAFDIRNWEKDQDIENYERERTMTDDDINKDFEKYVNIWTSHLKRHEYDKAKYYENRVKYFIDAVNFFDKSLASNIENNVNSILQIK